MAIEDRLIFKKMIEDNPGMERSYRCRCGKIYNTSRKMLPVILCPACGKAVAAKSITDYPNAANSI